MKKFMTPEVEIIKFAMQDVITVSGEEEDEEGGGIGWCI